MTRLEFDGGILRSHRREDAGEMARHGNNPRIAAQLMDRWPTPYTINHAEEWLDGVLGQDPERNLVIEVGGNLVGGLGIELGTDVYRGTAEIGYWLAEPFWGRGIMTAAIDCFCAWLFQRYRFRRIQARVYAGNPASARVLEKAGFVYEGTMKDAIIKLGQVQDLRVYARLFPTQIAADDGSR